MTKVLCPRTPKTRFGAISRGEPEYRSFPNSRSSRDPGANQGARRPPQQILACHGRLFPRSQNKKTQHLGEEIRSMHHLRLFAVGMLALVLSFVMLHAQSKEESSSVKVEATKTETSRSEQFKPEQQQTKGTVTIGGKTIDYDAYAGTLVVHAKDWDDVPQNADPDPKNKAPEASMFYVAYFKSDPK